MINFYISFGEIAINHLKWKNISDAKTF